MRTQALIILAILLSGCGASLQQKTLQATYIGVKAAEAGFVEWDRKHQEDIVAAAPSLPAGVEALQEYRLKRDPVLQAFMSAYQLLYVAAADKKDAKIDAAIRAAKMLYELIETIKKPAASPSTSKLDRPREGMARVRRHAPRELRFAGGAL